MTQLIPVILCGGAGSRLWPVSRELHPKPFIRLADVQSLLQKAWLRGAALADVAETMTSPSANWPNSSSQSSASKAISPSTPPNPTARCAK